MDILDPRGFQIALHILILGFIALTVYDLFVPTRRRDWPNHLLAVFTYGTANLVIWSWLIELLLKQAPPWCRYLGLHFILFVRPVPSLGRR